jgi:hypothetical protein
MPITANKYSNSSHVFVVLLEAVKHAQCHHWYNWALKVTSCAILRLDLAATPCRHTAGMRLGAAPRQLIADYSKYRHRFHKFHEFKDISLDNYRYACRNIGRFSHTKSHCQWKLYVTRNGYAGSIAELAVSCARVWGTTAGELRLSLLSKA